MSVNIVDALRDSSRPVFLFGCVPPRHQTSEKESLEICRKFVARGRVLALDGYIVYDVQDESSRTDVKRPFPFRKLQDPSWFAGVLSEESMKQCIVYKAAPCVSSTEEFQRWLFECAERDGHTAVNIVGAPSSKVAHQGPSTKEACRMTRQHSSLAFGCVSIAERHLKRGNEHEILMKKSEWGAEWFITQGIFNPEPTIRLLQDYSALCKQKGTVPKKIIFTFTPCGRRKTMSFIKWLGMNVPEEIEKRIFASLDENPEDEQVGNENNGEKKKKKKKKKRPPVEESCLIHCENLKKILEGTIGCGVPIGLNVESVSGYRDEIDATHELFRALQAILLDATGSPWVMTWSRMPWSPRRRATATTIASTKPVDGKNVTTVAEPALTVDQLFRYSSFLALGVVLGVTIVKARD